MFLDPDFFEDLTLAFRDWGRGESFWKSLAIYTAISVVFALIGLVIWKLWP